MSLLKWRLHVKLWLTLVYIVMHSLVLLWTQTLLLINAESAVLILGRQITTKFLTTWNWQPCSKTIWEWEQATRLFICLEFQMLGACLHLIASLLLSPCRIPSSPPSLVPRPHPKNRERGLVTLANYLVCAESALYVTITCLLWSRGSQLLLRWADLAMEQPQENSVRQE